MPKYNNAKDLFKWLASDELTKDEILNMLTEEMCSELIVNNNMPYLEKNGGNYDYHYDGEVVGTFKAPDVKNVFLLKCLHESRFGADAFASIHSSREDAEKYVDTVKYDSGYLDEEGRDDNHFTYDIEEFILDTNSFERAGESGKIKIDLGFATLVSEQGGDPNYNEVFIGLEDKDGVWSQDLAIIRQKYHYAKDVPVSKEVVQEKGIQVLVYGDKDNEDYTHEFSIAVYEEEKTLPFLETQMAQAETLKENNSVNQDKKLQKFFMTCNCYEPPFREEVVVKADNVDEAWDKAKKKVARKYKVKADDISITSVRREELDKSFER